ncbi:hypothetical protein RJ639_001967 [Escallonia herrerae]|uniref:Uncharacterized protein n=1 Tax=Escallonia herrerae TaxID=1293975 RepID=A0AA89BU05_9ASTE|nr:hypothetical protein RJ639_001967 [Escallonia herrerae]
MLEGSIPQSIGKLSNLQGLRINKRSISGQIPLSIGNMTRLSVLDLGGNMLQGSIPVTLSNISSLEQLNLGDSLLSGTIPEQVFGLSSLIILYLHQNHLTGQLPHQIVDPQIRLQMEDENETKANCKYSISTLENSLRSIFQIGLLCSVESPKERMDIRDVVVELHVVRGALLRA